MSDWDAARDARAIASAAEAVAKQIALPDPLTERRTAIQAEIDERAKTVGAAVINLFLLIRENTDRCVALTATLQALQPTQGAK